MTTMSELSDDDPITPVTWNHRVLVAEEHYGEYIEKSYAIHEVYYNPEGGIVGWTEKPVAACGDFLDGLHWQLDRMLACLSKPLLCPVGDDTLEELPSGLISQLTEKQQAKIFDYDGPIVSGNAQLKRTRNRFKAGEATRADLAQAERATLNDLQQNTQSLARQLASSKKIMKRRRKPLRKLAKT